LYTTISAESFANDKHAAGTCRYVDCGAQVGSDKRQNDFRHIGGFDGQRQGSDVGGKARRSACRTAAAAEIKDDLPKSGSIDGIGACGEHETYGY